MQMPNWLIHTFNGYKMARMECL